MTAIQTAAVAPLKVYIAGKITGDPEYKRKFLSAHMEQKNEGHIVLNPAHLPRGHEERGLYAHMPCHDRQRGPGRFPAGVGVIRRGEDRA